MERHFKDGNRAMTLGKKIALAVVAIVLLSLIALIVVFVTFDWNRLKPTINERVSAAIHRPFAIEGDLDRVSMTPVVGNHV